MNAAKSVLNFVMDILETIVFVGSIFIVVYLFIMEGQRVVGHSMDNTFHNGDYILTSKISFRFAPPKYGDIVVFKSPRNPDQDFIKRIIGRPGDRIRITEDGHVFVNEKLLTETYIATPTNLREDWFIKPDIEVTVPDGFLFVMGDNRSNSDDSRDFGFVPQTSVVGKVFFRYFPFDRFGEIKNTLS